MRTITALAKLLLISTAFTLCAWAAAQGTSPPQGHPLLGKWQWTRSDSACTDLYEFREGGVLPISSGSRRTDNSFTVSAAPDANGFYRVAIRVAKDHGGVDCGADAVDTTTQDRTVYVLFEPRFMEYLICPASSLDQCFGPFKRVQG
jgi:hypothetical protein